jgi:two-component system NtrC family sensor kinase
MARAYGLRFQIISSLALLITLLSGLLGFALISISSTAMVRERSASVRLTQLSAGRSIVSAVVYGGTEQVLREMSGSWLSSGNLDGIWVMDGSGNVKVSYRSDAFKDVVPKATFPATQMYDAVTLKAPAGAQNAGHVFTQLPAGRGLGCVIIGTHADRLRGPNTALGTLLVLYLLVHGIAILAFGYFSLTHLIVRPIDRLRLKAVRLGEGKFTVETERRGASEIQEVGEALSSAAARLKKGRDELVEKIDQLEKARAEILKTQDAVLRSQKLASVGRLTAGVAHEVGNPLTAILGFIDVLGDESLPAAERREYLDRMRQEAERVSRIIRDLLTFARADGKEVERVDMGRVVREACDIMKPQKLFKNVRIDCRLDEKAPAVKASRDRMTQVVVNLMLNAAEAMVGDGAVTITLSREEDGKTLALAVEDSGPGIPPDIVEAIFEPFVTTKPEGQGTGLGLSVCHGIVRSYGGTLTAGNRPEGGARFTLRLPAAAGDSAV